MFNRTWIILVLVLFLSVTGCAKKTMVVLVPDPDGSVGSATVSNQAGTVELDDANQATTIQDQTSAPAAPAAVENETIRTIFSEAISAQPLPPIHFILYFNKNGTDLTPESNKQIPNLLAAIEERNATDISVVGHTDTVGDKDYNFKLSKRRALAVSDMLVELGVRRDYIQTTSHGEENPLVKTEDNVSEPKNRRVEVVVR